MIKAKILAHSVSSVNGQEIVSFELEYPRIIHSELLTHRVFSRNAASSRAIPIDKLISMVIDNTAYPAEWGLNARGMQAKEQHTYPKVCRASWFSGALRAVKTARSLQSLGLHKQICNRPLEPFQYIKTVLTATEFYNWFSLRHHEDADPTIYALAKAMKIELDKSTPIVLKPGEWHLPYITSERLHNGNVLLCSGDTVLGIDEAIKVSASCCAQVSYRTLDQSVDKALKIYNILVESKPSHLSPFEHQANPMDCPQITSDDPLDIKDILDLLKPNYKLDSEGNLWSGNFKGWNQYRQFI